MTYRRWTALAVMAASVGFVVTRSCGLQPGVQHSAPVLSQLDRVPRSAAPALSAADEPSAPTPATDPQAVTVRDLLTGDPVEGASVTWRAEGAAEPVVIVSDAEGRLPQLALSTGHLRAVDPPWVMSPRAAQVMNRTGGLWLYREARAHVSIRFAGVSPNEDDIGAVRAVTRSTRSPGDGKRPGGPVFLASGAEKLIASVLRSLRIPSARAEAVHGDPLEWTISMPCARGVYVGAQCPGWYSEWVSLEQVPLDGTAVVHVALRRKSRVTGVVEDQDHHPLAGARVQLFVGSRIDTELVDTARLGLRDHAVMGGIGGQVTTISSQLHTFTNEIGEFEFLIDATGPAELATWPVGHQSVTRPIGNLVTEIVGVMLTAQAHSPPPVRIHNDGREVPGARIALVDLDAFVGDPRVPIGQLSSKSTLDVSWLERGRRYYLRLIGTGEALTHENGAFRWEGQSEIDVSTLDPHGR